jgi:hypothetical protein
MDPSFCSGAASSSPSEDDEWDAEGFEIPSLEANRPVAPTQKERSESTESFRPAFQRTVIGSENIYLGPHGAPPQQTRGQESAVTTATSRKQRLKQKLKDAEKRVAVTGRENKVEVLQDLMGSKHESVMAPRNSEEWLDPYCHESQFKRPSN